MPGSVDRQVEPFQDAHRSHADADIVERESRIGPHVGPRGVTRAGRPVRAFEGAPGAAAPQPLEQGLDEAHQPLPEIQHHDDENNGEDDLPIADLVAQIGGQDADQDRADDRAVERRPPADGGPDHQIGRKDEAAQLRGDEILLGRIEGAADAGEHTAEAEHGGLHILHREAAESGPAARSGQPPARGRRPARAEAML